MKKESPYVARSALLWMGIMFVLIILLLSCAGVRELEYEFEFRVTKIVNLSNGMKIVYLKRGVYNYETRCRCDSLKVGTTFKTYFIKRIN